MDLGLKGRVAIVTGGNRGIGYAISEELLREGAHVGDAVARAGAQRAGDLVAIRADDGDKAERFLHTVLPPDTMVIAGRVD